MTYSVLLVPELDGQITAILEGNGLSATALTREQALARLRYRAERVLTGQVERTTLDLPVSPCRLPPAPGGRGGLVALAGAFADDPDLPNLVEAAYAARDAQSDDSF